jgi:energy-coupling factor transport system ATP-binding protein
MMIKIDNLRYAYPEMEECALSGVSMTIQSGETILLTGRSGSGKSTLLRVMNGLVPHFFGGRFQGQAIIAGLNTRSATPIALSDKVGTVFQEPGYRFLTNNLIDEIAFGMELVELPGQEIRTRVETILDRFELGGFTERSLDRLSAGEQQRVAVAAALSRHPEILLLDEPTSQLDSFSTEAILSWVKELQAKFGLTLIIAEHRLHRMLDRIDRMAYLSLSGELEHLGAPQDILERLPYSTPLGEAAKVLGMNYELDSRSKSELKREVLEQSASEYATSQSLGEVRMRTKGLSFNYNGIRALQDVEVEVHAGEILALLGRNGAGKSTLLRCLMGLLQPDAGEIVLDGKRVDGSPVADLAKKVAYVPQWPSALLFAETLTDELTFTLKNHGLTGDPPIPIGALLESLGLLDVADRYPRDLSAGQRQRAALATVLVTKPEIILLDEPTLGMDPVAIADLGMLLTAWRDEGVGMVIATHDIEFAATIADRVLILGQGEVRAVGPTAETLFLEEEMRTALQRLIGRAYPASVAQLKSFVHEGGPQHAVYRSS